MDKIKQLEKTVELMQSGHAGLDRNGNIVDRRKKKGVPIKENKLMGNPKPKDNDQN